MILETIEKVAILLKESKDKEEDATTEVDWPSSFTHRYKQSRTSREKSFFE